MSGLGNLRTCLAGLLRLVVSVRAPEVKGGRTPTVLSS